jgi:hypothetical protein
MATAAKIEQPVKNISQWELGGGKFAGAGQEVNVLNSWRENSGVAFNLKNSVQVRYVGWEKQKWGRQPRLLRRRHDRHRTQDGSLVLPPPGREQTGGPLRRADRDGLRHPHPRFQARCPNRHQPRKHRHPSYVSRVVGCPGPAGQIVRTGERLASEVTRRAGSSSTSTGTSDSIRSGSPNSLPFVGTTADVGHERARRELDEVLRQWRLGNARKLACAARCEDQPPGTDRKEVGRNGATR